ncbi:MAG: flagellar export protein FliJ [Planctomycetes bacterium]|nr:flagellar export protein FliJ [Planctomycetota bacterium]
MKPFRFDLDPVLEYRRRVEETRRADQTLAQRDLAEVNVRYLACVSESKRAVEDLRRLADAGGEAVRVRAQQVYVAALGRRAAALREDRQRLNLRVHDLGERLCEAAQERRVLEKLKEARSANYALAVSRAEQTLMDEMAQKLHCARHAVGCAPASGLPAGLIVGGPA